MNFEKLELFVLFIRVTRRPIHAEPPPPPQKKNIQPPPPPPQKKNSDSLRRLQICNFNPYFISATRSCLEINISS